MMISLLVKQIEYSTSFQSHVTLYLGKDCSHRAQKALHVNFPGIAGKGLRFRPRQIPKEGRNWSAALMQDRRSIELRRELPFGFGSGFGRPSPNSQRRLSTDRWPLFPCGDLPLDSPVWTESSDRMQHDLWEGDDGMHQESIEGLNSTPRFTARRMTADQKLTDRSTVLPRMSISDLHYQYDVFQSAL
ncbi:hypothetical protein BDW68DRAFT_68119 [Aspergillus falconensis]